jgi:heme/copper-type cytochrome/quinol oxidase subunit 2
MVPGMFAYKSVIALMKIVSSPESNTMEYVSMFFHNSMLTILVMFGMVVGCVIPIFIFYRESFSVTRMNADGNHSSRLSAQNIKHMLASRKIILNLQHK